MIGQVTFWPFTVLQLHLVWPDLLLALSVHLKVPGFLDVSRCVIKQQFSTSVSVHVYTCSVDKCMYSLVT